MSRKFHRKKKTVLERATPSYLPGNATMYVPANMKQTLAGQVYYGSSLKGLPVGQTALFNPGNPLPTQPNVNVDGLPVVWRFPPQYNSFPVQRDADGLYDLPSFEQLKRLALMDYGVTLCERFWLDMVPKMTLNISLTPEAIEEGAEEKDFTKEKLFFKNFFAKPDGIDHLHSWIRKALINQSRYDGLWIYKNKTRGGKLLGLEIIDPAEMKPLLDTWGRVPRPPAFAYQQYPWGIPGYMYTQDQMIYYRETPADDTPYGFSRVERVIFTTNLALRKQKMDMAHYTEGNIPAGILTPPVGSNWTPDQLDAYEQSWNALLAGNLQQLARIKVTQPGFEYTPFVQPNYESEMDRFWLNIRTAAYGITPADLGFTETVNKSTGETQQDVTFDRTIGPLAMIYAGILTESMHTDFPPECKGEMFVAKFGGYEQTEDESDKAKALSTYTSAGILGLSNAAKLANLPEDPDAVHIGRVFFTANGPIFLDDVADPTVRAAQTKAQMAGIQMTIDNPGGLPPDDGDGAQNAKDTSQSDQKQSSGKDAAPAAKGSASAKNADKADSGDASDTKKPQTKAMKRATEELPRNTGVMIAFLLDPDVATHLALPDGEAPSDMHVTLAYLGDMYDVAQPGKLHPVQSLDMLKIVLSAYAGSAAPLHGRVGGLARFTSSSSSDGLSPIIALADVQGLQEWRRQLANVLASTGYHVANDFDYTPHITLSYIPDDAPMPVHRIPDDVSLNFDSLCLAVGDDRYFFPLGQLFQLPEKQERGTSIDALQRADYRRWRDVALKDIKQAKTIRRFISTSIPDEIHQQLSTVLEQCTTADEVRDVFRAVQDGETPFLAGAV